MSKAEELEAQIDDETESLGYVQESLTPKKRRQRRADKAPPWMRQADAIPVRQTDAERLEQCEAAEALTSLSELSNHSDDTSYRTEPPSRRRKCTRRVSFADGPFKGGPSDKVTPDGHPDHEGLVAVRRREISTTFFREPITKYNIKILEEELGFENALSLARLKRRCGLAPPVQRHLPYISPGNRRTTACPPPMLVFGKVIKPGSPNSQRRKALCQQPDSTPEAPKSGSRLLDLLEPLGMVSSH